MGSVGQMASGRHEYGLRAGQRTVFLFFAIVSGAMAALFFTLSGGDLEPSGTLLTAAAGAAISLYMAVVARVW